MIAENVRFNMAASIQQIRQAAEGWSIEVTPAGATKIDSFAACLAPGTTVNVTFLPGSDPLEMVAVTKRLHNEGMKAVPHLAARSLRDADQLDTLLAAYRAEAGVDEVLVIGGGVDKPVGAFDNSMQILETGLLQKHGIMTAGVAGHPEGSPDISEAEIADALAAKKCLCQARRHDALYRNAILF